MEVPGEKEYREK